MANHYVEAYPLGAGSPIEIPCPAVDMATGRGRAGSSGSFLSGGAYVRKSLYGARNFNVSWNNLNTEDTNRLIQLEEAGPFIWDNPMARQNVALPWLANHGNVEGSVNFLGTIRNYLIKDPDIISTEISSISGAYTGYPSENGLRTPTIKYQTTNKPQIDLMRFVIPDGYDCYAWYTGVTTGPVIRVNGSSIGMSTPGSGNLPTNVSKVGGTGVARVTLTGNGRIDLASIQIRLVPQGQPVGPLTYSPGLGTSALEFTEEGLQLVQHSAVLDMQSATANWMETGWWK